MAACKFLRTCARGTVQLVLCTFLLLTVAVLRFKHFDICTFDTLGERFGEFTCIRGKRRVQGCRPPFKWAVPRYLIGVDILGPIWTAFESYKDKFGKRPSFVMTALKISKGGALRHDTTMLDRVMSYEQFLNLMLAVANLMGFAALRLTTYSSRRFLPSVALAPQSACPLHHCIGPRSTRMLQLRMLAHTTPLLSSVMQPFALLRALVGAVVASSL